MGGAFKGKRLFGGQAVAQAFRAIQEATNFTIKPISFNYKFVSPGKVDVLIEYTVSRIGNNYRVLVEQSGKILGTAVCVAHGDQHLSEELELSYVDDVINAPPITDILTSVGLSKTNTRMEVLHDGIFELKFVESVMFPTTQTARNMLYVRYKPDIADLIPDNCGLSAVLVLSDFIIIQVATDTLRLLHHRQTSGASLHHTIRFHQTEEQINPHDWFLYRTELELLHNNRAKLRAFIYDSQRRCIISVIQEAYVTSVAKSQL